MRRLLIRLGVGVALVGVIIAGIAGGLVRWSITSSQLKEQILSDIRRSSGLTIASTGPMSLTLLPRPAIKLRTITMAGLDGALSLDAAALKGVLSLPALLAGKVRIAKTVLAEPTIAVDLDRVLPLAAAMARPTNAAEPAGPSKGLLKLLHTPGLNVRSGVLRLRSHDPRRDTVLSGITASLEWPTDQSGVSLSGTATWRGVQGDLALMVNSPLALWRGQPSAVDLRLKSPVLDLTLGATLSGRTETPSTGRLYASTPDLPRFMRMIGTPLPELDRIREARLNGDATMSNGVFALSGARLTFDDMLFEGALAFHNAAGHLGIAGTLATDRIRLDPFVKALPLARDPDGRWSTLPFGTRSVAYDEIDLRISASKASIGKVEFEDGGLSVQSGNGRMEISLGEVRAYDGLFKGRAVATLNGDATEVRGDATMSQFDLGALAEDLGIPRFKGTSTGHVILEGSGRSPSELIRSLSGRGQVSVRGGEIAPELVGSLVHPVSSGSAVPSVALPADPVTFDSASIAFNIAGGVASISEGWFLRPDMRAVLGGTASLVSQTLDLRAALTPANAGLVIESGAPPIVLLSGPWRDLRLSSPRPDTSSQPGRQPGLSH